MAKKTASKRHSGISTLLSLGVYVGRKNVVGSVSVVYVVFFAKAYVFVALLIGFVRSGATE